MTRAEIVPPSGWNGVKAVPCMRRFLQLVLLVLGCAFVANEATAQQAWNSVTVSWTTPGDDSLSGNASQFDLRYATTPITAANFSAATHVAGVAAPATPGTHQSHVVTGLQPATTYWFAIKTADEVPNWSGLSNVVSRTTAVAPDAIRPAPLTLTATPASDTSVTVRWTAVGDDSLTGTATSYDLRWSTSPITTGNWAGATQVSGEPAPAAPGTAQSMTVGGLARQTTYYFAAIAQDEAGNASALSNVPSATTTDSAPPAAIHDLALGLVWIRLSASAPSPTLSRRENGSGR